MNMIRQKNQNENKAENRTGFKRNEMKRKIMVKRMESIRRIPATIVLIDLNATTVYVFFSDFHFSLVVFLLIFHTKYYKYLVLK